MIEEDIKNSLNSMRYWMILQEAARDFASPGVPAHYLLGAAMEEQRYDRPRLDSSILEQMEYAHDLMSRLRIEADRGEIKQSFRRRQLGQPTRR